MTNMHHLQRRLDRLGAGRSIGNCRVVEIVREEEESVDEAFARWCVGHPDEAPPDAAADFIILTSIVSPKPQKASNGEPA